MKNKLWVLTALVSILFATTSIAQDTKNTDETREAVRKEREAAREKREAMSEERQAQRDKRHDEEEKRRDEEEARRDKAEMEREARAEGKCDTCKTKKHHSITISNQGIYMESSDSVGVKTKHSERQGKFSSNFALMDLGVNLIIDNTNYADPLVQNYLHVPASERTKSLFDLNTGKSVNVNIYPWMIKYCALKTPHQKIYISTGIGLQLYNFRYEEYLLYSKNPAGVSLDTVTTYKKDKLALEYLNVPLMATFKTRLGKHHWMVYGAGISEGFRLSSWNKTVSGQYGKVKTHGSFDLADFNTCVNFEIGIEGAIRFVASYQLTSLYGSGTGLDQHPISFGFRLSGI